MMFWYRISVLIIYSFMASILAGCLSLSKSDAVIELCVRAEIGDRHFCSEVEFEVYVNVLIYAGLRISDDDIVNEVVRLAEKSDAFPLVGDDDDMENDSSQFYFVVSSGNSPVYVVGISRKDDLLFFHPLNFPLKKIKPGYMFYPSLPTCDIRVCRNASLCKKIKQTINCVCKDPGIK